MAGESTPEDWQVRAPVNEESLDRTQPCSKEGAFRRARAVQALIAENGSHKPSH